MYVIAVVCCILLVAQGTPVDRIVYVSRVIVSDNLNTPQEAFVEINNNRKSSVNNYTNVNDNNISPNIQTTAKVPTQRIFLSRRVPEKVNVLDELQDEINRHRPSSSSPIAYTTTRNMDDGKIVFRDDPTTNQPTSSENNVTKLPRPLPVCQEVRTEKSGSPKNCTETTFDERASFDGDQCASGYKKVNGQCVEVD